MPSFLRGLVHYNSPHSTTALYVAAAIICLVAVLGVYLRCKYTKSAPHLEPGWIARTATYAAPIPIYVLLMLAPLDDHLLQVLLEDELIVALAGLYGLTEAFNDIRRTAGRAHEKVGP